MKQVYKYEFSYSEEREAFVKAHKFKYRLYNDDDGNLEGMDFFYKTNRGEKPFLPPEIFYEKEPLWMIYEYTKKDCMDADWIMMAGVSHKIEGVNYHSGYADSFFTRDSHASGYDFPRYPFHRILKQCRPAIIKSDRKPDGKYHLFSDMYPYVFCDPQAREMIKNSDLKGVKFLPVYWKKRYKPQKNIGDVEAMLIPKQLMPLTKAIRDQSSDPDEGDHDMPGTLCENVFQMTTEYVIPQSAMDFSEVWRVYPCNTCGDSLYENFPTHPIILKKGSLDPSIDMYMTESIFAIMATATPRVVISNRFYRFLLEHEMTRGAHFMPVLYERG